ncbi:MAG: NADH-quinone oxidoreductase subunit C [Verrucomicrobiales bacterium]|nr:NADH-quinone oxidoreductase subunit C [Verrucomicrobiales bacterium]
METLDQIQQRIALALPGKVVALEANTAACGGASLVVDRRNALELALFLRDDPALRLDFCSNATGVDWLDRSVKVKVKKGEPGAEKEVEETRVVPGYLEVVYHLYSVALKHGPVVMRVRTPGRSGDVSVPSMTPVWRSCELQEREIYDLFGIHFENHPDLRRLMMWEGFQDHPMRKDYVAPDDFEYEPTPHDEVLERSQASLARREVET